MPIRQPLLVCVALLLSWPAAPATAGPATPEGIHVSFGADPRSQASVAWITYAPDPGSLVEYGPTPELGLVASGLSRTAPGSDRVLHEVHLAGLPADSLVHYRAGSPNAWSAVHTFRTAPAEPRPFRFVLFGDHGTSAQSERTVEFMANASADLAIIAGDLSYASGSAARWDQWFRILEPLAASVPTMPAPGNHEDEGSRLGTSAYRTRFALPGREMFYSFDYARTHFLVLHSTLDTAARELELDDMLAFAERDLRAATERRDAGELDFLVVVQHHPLYGNQAGSATSLRQVNAPLVALEEPLLHRYRVDLLLVGHNHHYERSHPMAAGLPTPLEDDARLGVVQVISGGGGRSLYEFRDPNDFDAWSAAHARRFHYVEFDVGADSIRARAIAVDDGPGELLDEFVIPRRS